MEIEAEDDNAMRAMEEAVKSIMEHVDNVQIVGSVYDADEKKTRYYSVGAGNFFARVGLAREWVNRADECGAESGNSEFTD